MISIPIQSSPYTFQRRLRDLPLSVVDLPTDKANETAATITIVIGYPVKRQLWVDACYLYGAMPNLGFCHCNLLFPLL